MWLEVAIMASIFALGHILLGHFEAGTPKWRQVGKFFLSICLAVAISNYAGRFWFYLFLVASLMYALVIHLWWLPKHVVNGWTAEPKERYYELRGWKL